MKEQSIRAAAALGERIDRNLTTILAMTNIAGGCTMIGTGVVSGDHWRIVFGSIPTVVGASAEVWIRVRRARAKPGLY